MLVGISGESVGFIFMGLHDARRCDCLPFDSLPDRCNLYVNSLLKSACAAVNFITCTYYK